MTCDQYLSLSVLIEATILKLDDFCAVDVLPVPVENVEVEVAENLARLFIVDSKLEVSKLSIFKSDKLIATVSSIAL